MFDMYTAYCDSKSMRGEAGFLPFPYAQLSEIWETDLKLLDGLCTGDVVFSVTRLALLLYSSHVEASIRVVAN